VSSGALRHLFLVGQAFGLVALPAPVRACAACFGQSDDAMAQGMNLGIFTLLIVTVFVLLGLAACGIFLARRSARLAAHPPEQTSPAESPELPQTTSHPTPS